MARELIFSVTKKDLRVETMRGSGKGGQNRNVRETAVRITHIPSKAVGYSCDERYQHQNKKLAFARMRNHWRFKLWLDKQFAQADIETGSTRRYTYKGNNPSFETRVMDRE